jgi:adenylylsulfate kinase-like enzyme
VAWLTGLPASGKSTLGRALVRRLRAAGAAALLLDSDALREALGRPAGRGAAERDAFYLALARLAALLSRQGLTVVVAATANRRLHRARARARCPHFVEVHVATPAAECARRDPKGLWAGTGAGRVRGLPGAGAAYEPPLRAEVTARGGRDRKALEALVSLLLPAVPHPAIRTGIRRRPKWPGAGSKRPGMAVPQVRQAPLASSR